MRSLARKGRSTGTQGTYRWLLRDFGRWLDHCRILAPEQLVPEVLYSWQDQLLERSARPSTRSSATTVLRGVLRWGAREELGVPPLLWERVEAVTVPRGLPRPLEPAHRDQLLAYVAQHRRGLGALRDRALFLFLLTTGSRISAVLRLDVADVAGGGPAGIIIRQKGGNEHRLLPSATAWAWMEEYLRARGRDGEPALWIRIGARGRHRLTKAGANQLWDALAKRAKVPPFTSHVLRHTSATELGELTESDQEVADHVGWTSTAMMQRYRQVRQDRRRRLVDRLDALIPAVPDGPAPPPYPRILKGRRS